MGKYVDVIPKLKRKESPRDERIEQLKHEYGYLTAEQLAEHYAGYRAIKAELEAEESIANQHIEALEQLLIETSEAGAEAWGAYGAAENVLRRANGDKIEVRDEVSVKTVDPDAVRGYIRQQGLERLLTVNAQTWAGHVKEKLLAGDEVPPGTDVSTWKKIVFTPVKK